MNLRTFYKRLATFKGKAFLIPRPWYTLVIRVGWQGFCPIDAIGGDWSLPDGGLGFDETTKEDIVNAADSARGNRAQRIIRARMIEVLGIE